MQKYIFRGLVCILAAVFLVSIGLLADYFIDSYKSNKLYGDLANQVQQNRPTSSENVLVTIKHPDTGEDMQILQEYAPIFQQNTDLVGWIRIEDTNIDYPVLQTPDSPNYYLYRNFNKQDDKHGAIYADAAADVAGPSDNVTIYGHRMNDKTMFRTLLNFQDKAFFEAHRYVYFDTLTEHHIYEIIAVFQTTADPGKVNFAYNDFVSGSEAEFDEYVANCKELSWFDSGVEA